MGNVRKLTTKQHKFAVLMVSKGDRMSAKDCAIEAGFSEASAQQQAATQAGLGTLSFDPTTGTVTGVGAGTGVGGFQPFLDSAQAATGPTAFQAFQSPYQQAVTDATLTEFDRTREIT